MKTYQRDTNFEFINSTNYMGKRNIPPGVILKMWLGNPLSTIGLVFFLFGLPFAFVFISFSDLFSTSFDDKDPIAQGVIVELNATNSYVNDHQVFEYKYQFKLNDGNGYYGTGFSTGKTKSVGDEVSVYYKDSEPSKSMAIGLRASEFGGYVGLLTLIFPGIGFGMLFFGTRKVVKQLAILKVGDLAEGRFLYKEATNMQINKQTVYELTFEFTTADGKKYHAIAKTHQYHRLEDEAFEMLVYDPRNPEKAVLLDELPRGIKNFFLKMAQ